MVRPAAIGSIAIFWTRRAVFEGCDVLLRHFNGKLQDRDLVDVKVLGKDLVRGFHGGSWRVVIHVERAGVLYLGVLYFD